MLKKLKKKELKHQRKHNSTQSKQIWFKQMIRKVYLKNRSKKHYQKLKRRSLQRRKKQLRSSNKSNLLIKMASVLLRRLLSEQKKRDLKQRRPKGLSVKDLPKKLKQKQSKIVLK